MFFAGEEEESDTKENEDQSDEGSDSKDDDEEYQEGDDLGDEDDDDDDEEEDDEEEDEDDDEEEDDDDDLPEGEQKRRKRDKVFSRNDTELTASMEAMVDLLVENPDLAESKLKQLQKDSPALANKLAKMYENKSNNKLGSLLKDADPAIKAAFDAISKEVQEIKQTSRDETVERENKTYDEWTEGKEYLDPKSKSGSKPAAKKLRNTLLNILDERFSEGALTEKMLNQALLLAKDEEGWQDTNVSKAKKKQAAEQATKKRAHTAASGGTGVKASNTPKVDKEVLGMFGDLSTSRAKKVAAAKKEAGMK